MTCTYRYAELIAREGVRNAFLRDRVREDTPDRRQHRSRNSPLRSNRKLRHLPRKFPAAIQPYTEFLQDVTGQIGIIGAFNTPEAQSLFVLLQHLERFLELLHGGVEGRRQEVGSEGPSTLSKRGADANVVFAVLIPFHRTNVGVSVRTAFCGHLFPQS